VKELLKLLTCQNVKRNEKIVEGLPKGAQQVKPEKS
jgi:hypothetical protein